MDANLTRFKNEKAHPFSNELLQGDGIQEVQVVKVCFAVNSCCQFPEEARMNRALARGEREERTNRDKAGQIRCICSKKILAFAQDNAGR